MNAIYNINDYLKNKLAENEFITTVIEGRSDMILDDNFWKKNLYPLAIVFPAQVELTSPSVSVYAFDVAVISQRDQSNYQIKGDKMNNQNDNLIDNLNAAQWILKELVNSIRLLGTDDFDEIGIHFTVEGLPTLDRVTNFGINQLDGYRCLLRLRVENEIPFC